MGLLASGYCFKILKVSQVFMVNPQLGNYGSKVVPKFTIMGGLNSMSGNFPKL